MVSGHTPHAHTLTCAPHFRILYLYFKHCLRAVLVGSTSGRCCFLAQGLCLWITSHEQAVSSHIIAVQPRSHAQPHIAPYSIGQQGMARHNLRMRMCHH